jgi:hypothetical protein
VDRLVGLVSNLSQRGCTYICLLHEMGAGVSEGGAGVGRPPRGRLTFSEPAPGGTRHQVQIASVTASNAWSLWAGSTGLNPIGTPSAASAIGRLTAGCSDWSTEALRISAAASGTMGSAGRPQCAVAAPALWAWPARRRPRVHCARPRSPACAPEGPCPVLSERVLADHQVVSQFGRVQRGARVERRLVEDVASTNSGNSSRGARAAMSIGTGTSPVIRAGTAGAGPDLWIQFEPGPGVPHSQPHT